jgi:hypothetical protein
MVGHALWFEKIPNNFHKDNGIYLAVVHQLFFSGVFGWHSHLQQDLGGTLVAYSVGFAYTMTTQDICQLGKIPLWHGHGPVPRLHC